MLLQRFSQQISLKALQVDEMLSGWQPVVVGRFAVGAAWQQHCAVQHSYQRSRT